MNIQEAAKSGKPFTNPNIIGAWCCVFHGVDYYMVHRDNISDFDNMEWIKENCLRQTGLYWMSAIDLIRTDWKFID